MKNCINYKLNLIFWCPVDEKDWKNVCFQEFHHFNCIAYLLYHYVQLSNILIGLQKIHLNWVSYYIELFDIRRTKRQQ